MSDRRKLKFNRLATLLLLALPIVVVSLSFSYRSFHQYREDGRRLRASRQMITDGGNLLLDLRRAESAQRGFLLNQQPYYSTSYRKAAEAVAQDLSALVRDAAPAHDAAHITKIRELSGQKLQEMSSAIELSKQDRESEALDLMKTYLGDNTMQQISTTVGDLQREEQAQLDESRTSSQRNASNTLLVSSIGFGAMLLFLAGAGWAIDQDTVRSARDQQSIRTLNEQLTKELKTRTDILESIQDGFCAFDAQGMATYANPAAESLLSSSVSRITGRGVEEIFHLPEGSKLLSSLPQVRERRSVLHHEEFFPAYRKWFQLRFFPVAGGGFSLYFADITGPKDAETERVRLLSDVQDARALLDTFFDKAPLGLVCWDAEMRFVRLNQALASISGLTPEEHIGKTVAEITPELSKSLSKIFVRVLAGESITGMELTGAAPGRQGKRRTWITSYYPIRLHGQGVLVGGIVEDITERKTIEESLRQAAKLESLGVLAGGIAHDFNNLLTGILGNSSLAIETLSPHNPARNILGDVVTASERAAHLTRQMLAYAGRGRFVMQLVDVSELVREIASLVRISIPRNVQLRLELQDRIPCVVGDTSQLQQLVMNLVINGAEAIPADQQGSVLITSGAHEIDEGYIRQTFSNEDITPGRYVYLEVHDTGVGMDQDTISRIFDPFFTTKFTGRGLGLAAVMGIVRGHKGTLKVYSTPGKGTAFKVLLPASDDVAPKPETVNLENAGQGSGTILVIDDEDIVRRTTKATLEKFGYAVVMAENGREGVDLLRVLAEKVVLVILDLTMPVMSGEEALREIRKISPGVKIVLSSGYNESEAVQRFNGKSLSGFLQKPYTARKLAEAVRSALASGERV